MAVGLVAVVSLAWSVLAGSCAILRMQINTTNESLIRLLIPLSLGPKYPKY